MLHGRSTWDAPGFSCCACLKALRMISLTVSARTIWRLRFVTGSNSVTRSRYWCDVMCMRSVPTWPVMQTSGAPSMFASATPVMRFVAPGPSVPRQTPARPVRRPYMSAMNAAPCSWRTVMNWMGESRSASMISRFSSPGMPKMYLTPSLSKHLTRTCAVFISIDLSLSTLSKGKTRAAMARVSKISSFISVPARGLQP